METESSIEVLYFGTKCPMNDKDEEKRIEKNFSIF